MLQPNVIIVVERKNYVGYDHSNENFNKWPLIAIAQSSINLDLLGLLLLLLYFIVA